MSLKPASALAIAALVLLAACGKSGGAASGASGEACAMISKPDTLFGAHAEASAGAGLDAAAGYCHWQAADGRRGGDLVLYTPASLGAVTPAAQMAEIVTTWDKMSETPLAPLAHVGDEAQIATDLPGYQTQIVFRKGDKLITLLAWSGDPAMTGEALARAMAAAASK